MNNSTPADLHGWSARQYMLRQPCWFAGVMSGYPQDHLDRIRSEFPSDPIDIMYHAEERRMSLWVFGAQTGPQCLLHIGPGECVGSVIDRLRESRHNAQHRDWKAWLKKTNFDMKAASKEATRKAVELEDPDAVADAWMKARGKGRIHTQVTA